MQRSGKRKGKRKEQEKFYSKNFYLFKKNFACDKPYFYCDGTNWNKVLYFVAALCIRQNRLKNLSPRIFAKFCLHIR